MSTLTASWANRTEGAWHFRYYCRECKESWWVEVSPADVICICSEHHVRLWFIGAALQESWSEYQERMLLYQP